MKHDPLCQLSQPCDPDIPEHGYCEFSAPFFCIHCHTWCICEELGKKREQAIRDCIAVIRTHKGKAAMWRPSDQPDEDYYKALDQTVVMLRALLEGAHTPPPLPPSVGIPEKKGSLW